MSCPPILCTGLPVAASSNPLSSGLFAIAWVIWSTMEESGVPLRKGARRSRSSAWDRQSFRKPSLVRRMRLQLSQKKRLIAGIMPILPEKPFKR